MSGWHKYEPLAIFLILCSLGVAKYHFTSTGQDAAWGFWRDVVVYAVAAGIALWLVTGWLRRGSRKQRSDSHVTD